MQSKLKIYHCIANFEIKIHQFHASIFHSATVIHVAVSSMHYGASITQNLPFFYGNGNCTAIFAHPCLHNRAFLFHIGCWLLLHCL